MRDRLHVVAVAAALAGSAFAQTPDQILADLPSDAVNLLVIRDPLPHLDAILASPELREAAIATADLQEELAGFTLDPARLAKLLQPFRDYVPSEIVVATDPESARHIARAIAFGMALALLLQTNGQLDAEEAAPLKGLAESALAALQLPQLSARVRFRSERMAAKLFDQLLDALPEQAGFTIEAKDDHIDFRLEFAELEGKKIPTAMQSVALDPAPLAKLTLTARLQQSGDALVLTVGKPKPGPLPTKSLRNLWRADAAQLLYAQFDCRSAIAELDSAVETIDEVELPATAEPLKTSLLAGLERMTSLTGSSSSSIVLENGMSMVTEEDLGEIAAHLPLSQPPEALRRSIAPQDGPFALVGMTLDLLLLVSFDQVFDRMASKANQPGGMEALSLARERSAQLVEYLSSAETSIFEDGVLIASRAAAPAKAADGAALPLAAFAVLAQTKGEAAGLAFARRMTELTAAIFGGDGDGMIVEADLGLGVPTLQLKPPAIPGVTMPASWQPHIAQRGNLLVASTDPEWTKTLLERSAAAPGRGASSPAENALAWQSCSGDHAAAGLDAIGAWIGALQPQTKPGLAVLRALAGLVVQIEAIDSQLFLDGSTMRDAMTVRLRPRQAK